MVIKAKEVIIHESVDLNPDKIYDIDIKGTLKIGAYSQLGNCKIRGNNITIGEHFYSTDGLNIGGGGCNSDESNLMVGDRCTFHNNFINIAKPVIIGNDVGLSPEVSILTHGFWLSVLEGYPARFEGVKIGNGVIVGYRSCINAGVHIENNIIIGSHSNVTKPLLKEKAIYGGNPAKFIKVIREPTNSSKKRYMLKILKNYKLPKMFIERDFNYPVVSYCGFTFNVETFEYYGQENAQTDDFRDYLRRYGIRIYTKRPFKSL